VVDDWDMGITHVLRGDDHVNNTPRQINILKALGAPLPEYGHLPMILGPDGEKLSKRHGAVSVMAYEQDGYLADAMINYLARLGWSHGDDEIFSREQLIEWFDSDNLSKSAAQWDPKKLNWVNAHYIKAADNQWLADAISPRLIALGADPAKVNLAQAVELLKDRCETLVQLTQASLLFCAAAPEPDAELVAKHITNEVRQAVADFAQGTTEVQWQRQAIGALIKSVLERHHMKMPQLAIPLRLIVAGTTQTPAIDAVLEIMGRETVLQRLRAF
jgi:glutamyl-tRNA synthetase